MNKQGEQVLNLIADIQAAGEDLKVLKKDQTNLQEQLETVNEDIEYAENDIRSKRDALDIILDELIPEVEETKLGGLPINW